MRGVSTGSRSSDEKRGRGTHATARVSALAAVLVLVLVVAGALSSARAATMKPLGTRQLVLESARIVEGTVVSQRVLQMDGRLWTESRIRVLRAHKGAIQRGAVLAVRQLGGVLGRLGLRVAGVARFQPGEQVLAFLRPIGSYHVVVGLCQGKYAVYRDVEGVERVRRDLSGSFARFDGAGRVTLTPSLRVVGVPDLRLEQLVSEIRTVVAATASSSAGGGR